MVPNERSVYRSTQLKIIKIAYALMSSMMKFAAFSKQSQIRAITNIFIGDVLIG